MSCQICNEETRKIIDLGDHPLVHAMSGTEKEAMALPRWPLLLVQCLKCHLVQLSGIIDRKTIFTINYPYRTKMTASLVADLHDMCFFACRNLGRRTQSVLDIGCNDGAALDFFSKNVKTFGIEPTNAGLGLNVRHVLRRGFFPEAAESLGRFDIILASNVFAHVPDPVEFLAGVRSHLRRDGVFVFQQHSLDAMNRRCGYDPIYHDHLRYYHANFLVKFLSEQGFLIQDIVNTPAHGGSLRIACRVGIGAAPVNQMELNLNAFAGRVEKQKDQLWNGIFASEKPVYGLGATARANTILNYCGLTSKHIRGILELPGSEKIGKFMPGSGIPVISEEGFSEDVTLVNFIWYIRETKKGEIPAVRET